MNVFVALLRAVNVGGTGKLPMSDLRALCEGLGFQSVTTYIQSGNVVFRSGLTAASAQRSLEVALASHLGKMHAAHVRSGAELRAIEEKNPFPDAAPNQVLVLFLADPPDEDTLAQVEAPGGEVLRAGNREVYIHFPHGMGRSKLKIPFTSHGTGRNLNTVRKLVTLADAVAAGA